MNTQVAMSEALDLLGGDSGGVFGTVVKIMDLYERAHSIASEYKEKRPDRPVYRLLKYMVPEGEFLKLTPELFEAHVRELIERAINFIDDEERTAGHKVYVPRGKMGRVMECGTAAEALIVLKNTSLATPLHNDAGALYFKLFMSCFPGKVDDPNMRDVFQIMRKRSEHESYPGAVRQLESEVRNKCAHNRDRNYNGNGGERVKRWDDRQLVSQPELITD